MEDAARILQLVVNGAASGCIYGLIALGFVLIYKATEMVNFAQGDIMMLGGFVAFSPDRAFRPALLGRRAARHPDHRRLRLRTRCSRHPTSHRPAAIRRGNADPRTWLYLPRRSRDHLGLRFRRLRHAVHQSSTIDIGGLILGEDNLSIIVGTVLLCGVLYLFFSKTRVGVAMQASSQNQLAAYYMGIPVRTIFSLIWAISAGVAAVAGILLSPVSMIDVNMGFLGIKAFAAAVIGGFGSIPGALIGGVIVGIVEQFAGYYLPAGFQEVTSNVVLLAMLIMRPQGLFAERMGKRV